MERALRNAVAIVPDRVYYVALTTNPNQAAVGQRHFFSIDNEMVYWNFYLDFGPLNLGHVYRFCLLMNHKLKDPKLQDKTIYFYSAEHPHKRTNAVFLITAWLMLCKGKGPDEAFAPFKGYYLPFPPWHDATPTVCHFNLTILDTLRGLHKAREHKFFDFHTFNVEEYEHYEQVENGDLNWCMEGRFLAFAGPHAERQCSPGGYYNLRPDDYVSYFKRKNVALVVRLNKPYYDAKKFTAHGIDHMELYFIDGSNPPDPILHKFITRCEETDGAIAVHCKAGLGRTGTCIGCYMMKHFRITAEEIIGWLRIVRPGSIIGPQQQFMKEMQLRMWRDGDLMRARLHQPTLALDNGAGNGGIAAIESERDDQSSSNGKAGVLSPSSVIGRSGVPNPVSPAAAGSQPTTPNSLARRMNKMTIGGTSSATASPATTTSPASSSASSAAVNAQSGRAEREGRETQGDLLRMRRAQAASAHSSPAGTSGLNGGLGGTPTSSYYPSTGAGSAGTPLSSAGRTTLTPSSNSRLSSSLGGSSGALVRPDSRGGVTNSPANGNGVSTPKSDSPSTSSSTRTSPSTRSSFGNFLGFGK